MTWEILVGLITLCSFGLAIGKVISNNTQVVTELKCSVDALTRSMGEQKEKQDEFCETLNKHETRITVLEREVGHE